MAASWLPFNPKVLLWNATFENSLYWEFCFINRLCYISMEVNTSWIETRSKMWDGHYAPVTLFLAPHQHLFLVIFHLMFIIWHSNSLTNNFTYIFNLINMYTFCWRKCTFWMLVYLSIINQVYLISRIFSQILLWAGSSLVSLNWLCAFRIRQ